MNKSIKEKIIDLVPAGDGTYVPSNEKRSVVKVIPKKKNMDNFLEGMDIGLDLLDKFDKRIRRLMKLKR